MFSFIEMVTLRTFSGSVNIAMSTVFVQNGISLRGVSWFFFGNGQPWRAVWYLGASCKIFRTCSSGVFQPKSVHITSLLWIFSVSCCRSYGSLWGLWHEQLFSSRPAAIFLPESFCRPAEFYPTQRFRRGICWKQSWHINKRLKYNIKFCPQWPCWGVWYT